MTARAAAAPSPTSRTATITCPDVGTIVVALPSGVTTPALSSDVQLTIGFQGRDARTGATVSDGGAPGTITCTPVPFAGLPASDVTNGALPAGVAPGDLLTGNWTVSVTITASAPSPSHGAETSGGDQLVYSVQAYLATRADSASVAVYDAKTGVTRTVAPQNSYITASIVKADILATLLHQAQAAGHGLSAAQQATARQMIEFSDNNAATTLWNQVGGGPGVAAFNSGVPMPSTVPGSGGLWGLTRTTASDQVALVKDIAYPNGLLGPSQRAYEQGLMENVTPSQKWGVSGGVPAGVTVALKNGWLPVSNGWEINSIGHIFGANRDYVIAVLTSGNPSMGYGISTIQGVSSLIWSGLSAQVPPSRPAVGRKGDGSLEVFATSGGRLLTSWQSGPGTAFGGWLDMGLPVKAYGVPAVGQEHNGGLQVFVTTPTNRLLTSWQSGPASPFGAWLDMGPPAGQLSDPAVAVTSTGAMSVVMTAAGRVVTSWQSVADGPFGGWLDLGMPSAGYGVPAVGQEQNGGLQLFVRTSDSRLLTTWQSGPAAPFGGWLDLGLDGGVTSDPSVAMTSAGTLSIVAGTAGGGVVTSWQSAVNGPFGGWLSLHLPASLAGVPALATEANGGLEVFASTTDSRLLTAWQGGPTSPFGGWLDLGADGAIGSDPAVGTGGNGAIAAFTRSVAGSTLVTAQVGPNQPFTAVVDLNMPH